MSKFAIGFAALLSFLTLTSVPAQAVDKDSRYCKGECISSPLYTTSDRFIRVAVGFRPWPIIPVSYCTWHVRDVDTRVIVMKGTISADGEIDTTKVGGLVGRYELWVSNWQCEGYMYNY
jgi:hypothetical protein